MQIQTFNYSYNDYYKEITNQNQKIDAVDRSNKIPDLQNYMNNIHKQEDFQNNSVYSFKNKVEEHNRIEDNNNDIETKILEKKLDELSAKEIELRSEAAEMNYKSNMNKQTLSLIGQTDELLKSMIRLRTYNQNYF